MGEERRPLRVLRIIARLNIGGPARHAIILNEGLHRDGFETLLVFGSLGPEEAGLEAQARGRAWKAVQIPELGRRITAGNDLRAFLGVWRLIREWQPDVVHTHTAKAGSLGRLAALLYNATTRRTRRCAVLHTFHGHVFEGYFGKTASALVRMTERSLARITDCIITISERQRHDITRRFRIAPASKVVVVPLGLELGDLLAMPSRVRHGGQTLARADRPEVVAGFVGRLVSVKDLRTLLAAVASAATRVPGLRLVIAGDGEERVALQSMAAELRIADRVAFQGWREDLPALYASMDLFAMTSINEGTPVSLIEAMAAGVPAVSTAVGGVPDVLSDGITGTLVPARSPEAVAAAIVDLVEHPARALAMAAEARRRVAERFDARRLVTDIEGLYLQTLTRKRRAAVARPAAAAQASSGSDA